MQRQPSRAGCQRDSGEFLARAGWCLCVAKATCAPKHGLGFLGQPCGRGCIKKAVQKAPSVSVGGTQGFAGAAAAAQRLPTVPGPCARLPSENRTCAACATWPVGQCLSQAIRVATISGVPVSLSSVVFKSNFLLKIHLFLSLIISMSLVSGSSNSQLFLFLSDWIVRRAGVLQKRYLPFIICKLPSGYKVGVYGFKLIRATEQSFVMCITWGEEKHLKFRATFSREENYLVTAIVDLGMCFRC